MAGLAQKDEEEPDDVEGDEDVIHMGDDDEESDGVEDEEWEEADGVSLGMGLDGMDQDPVGFSSSAMAGLAQKIPLPVVALGGVGVGVFVLLKLKRLFGGGDFADSQARYRRCNRCAKKGAKVRCTRCRRAYYCTRACLKAAWKLEICECC